ncbi:MAG TPA: isoleucine--tRNA ligase [Methanocorpusculum sp.]|nr:isoleucine--tRNA ligase [Methanocorpusculum sp.]
MNEITENYVASNIESKIQQYWSLNNIYKKTRELRSSGKNWLFVDGPPYTTGYIHLGTAWNKILKDCILRYQSMNGWNIIERAGYDMHGLPIEVKVEELLNFKNKTDIEKYGVANFIEECKKFALVNKDKMSDQFKNLGIWLDFDNPYLTVSKDYIETAWHTLKSCDDNKFLERGSRVVNWCPRCGTAIADAEVEYWDEQDPSIFVKFKIVDRDNESLVIWTTTPWTLPANIAVAVNNEFVYAKVKAIKGNNTEYLWIAKDLVEQILKYGKYNDYTIIETKKGSELVGLKYISPLENYVPMQTKIQHRVVSADYVTLENTGMVHIAPGHGWDDYLVGIRENLPIICPVDENGRFNEEAGTFVGLYVKDEDTNNKVMDALGDSLLAKRKITHRYGHCWRCKTPIIYRATSQWFLKVKDVRDKMLNEISNDVNWYPDWAGSARFHDWISEARDWCISRQRYWGIPIPIWVCSACNKYKVIGSYSELEKLSGQKLDDPHRPYVDDITIKCECCGAQMKRVPDIFDVWYDSGIASWATLKYPQQTQQFNQYWPADLILEGQDQTRGWFYSQLALSTMVFDKAPYKSVMMHGFALDANGKKMSKSLNNVIKPEDVIEQFGVDVLRQYILSASAPWDELRFSIEGTKTIHRMFNVLWNVYKFPIPYMKLDNYSPKTTSTGCWDPSIVEDHITEFCREDKWIISRINSIATQISNDMSICNTHRASRPITTFILDELSRWYVQLVRPRMWLEEDSVSKNQAYETMYYVLRRLITIFAPFAPHISEEIYQNMKCPGDPESVHMQDWFSGNSKLIDSDLEEKMSIIMEFDEAVSNARQTGKRKGRWPVGEIVVSTTSDVVKSAITEMNNLCCSRANARKVNVIMGTWDRVKWTAKPVMNIIGKQFGKNSTIVKKFIEESDGNKLKSDLDKSGLVKIDVDGFSTELTHKHMIFEEKLDENIYSSPIQSDSKVYVDITLTPELESEGYARELIRRIQEMRKRAKLDVNAQINCEVIIQDKRISDLMENMRSLISDEVHAKHLSISSTLSINEILDPIQSQEWDIDSLKVLINIGTIT